MSDVVLVTGGAGMIGSNLVAELVNQGHRVKVVDNLWRGSLDNLQRNGECIIDLSRDFYNVDLRKSGLTKDMLENVSFVYHLADIVAGIGYVFNNQSIIFRDNVLINSNVINSVKEAGLKGYIYVGTACSFPEHLQKSTDTSQLRESDQYPASPESAYGWSKLMGEYEAELIQKEFGLPVAILSLHNVYGTPCVTDSTAQVITSIVRRVIESTDSVVVWGSGNQGRAFVHVSDVVAALISAKQHGLGRGVIQIGPDYCTTIKELVETVVEISGKSLEIKFDLSKPQGDIGRFADYSKARDLLGWKPTISLKNGLNETYNWINKKIR